MKILDCHVHVGKNMYLNINAKIEELLAVADKAGIEKLFCTELTALFYDMREGNKLLGAELKMYPDRLIGYATISSPYFAEQAVDEIRRCYFDYGMRGIKVYSVAPVRLNPWIMEDILALSAEYKLPMLAHITPAECDELARANPSAIIVMAHMGCFPDAGGDWRLAIEVARRHRNVWLDTTSSTYDCGMLEMAVRRLGADRILFGSDMPLLDPFAGIEKVRSSVLTDEEKSLILGGNLARLLSQQSPAAS
jgi:uncharacterized protein